MSTVGNIIIIEDVTERVHLEEQLQISDKMASVGLLAAGVAHEVNTPLTGISSFTQMLLSDADPNDPRTRMLEKIEQQTFRAAKIVNGLLNLSRVRVLAASQRAPCQCRIVEEVRRVFDRHSDLIRKVLLGGRSSFEAPKDAPDCAPSLVIVGRSRRELRPMRKRDRLEDGVASRKRRRRLDGGTTPGGWDRARRRVDLVTRRGLGDGITGWRLRRERRRGKIRTVRLGAQQRR